MRKGILVLLLLLERTAKREVELRARIVGKRGFFQQSRMVAISVLLNW